MSFFPTEDGMTVDVATIGHFDVAGKDIRLLTRFYTAVFGWEVTQQGPGYAQVATPNLRGAMVEAPRVDADPWRDRVRSPRRVSEGGSGRWYGRYADDRQRLGAQRAGSRSGGEPADAHSEVSKRWRRKLWTRRCGSLDILRGAVLSKHACRMNGPRAILRHCPISRSRQCRSISKCFASPACCASTGRGVFGCTARTSSFWLRLRAL